MGRESDAPDVRNAENTSDTPHYENVPEEWIMCTIGDLFDVVSAKRVLKSDWKNKGIPFYRAREIVQLHKEGIADKDLFITEELFAELKDKFGTPNVGDIMLSAVGSIGYTYIVNEKDSFYYKDASVLCLRNVNKLNSQYFSMLFETTFVKEQMHDNSKGTTVDTITIEKLKKYFVPLPPLAEQYRIISEIEKWFAFIDIIESGKTDLQTTIKQTKCKILDLAIHGKLVPQDPNDEPASELLKRINPAAEITCDNGQYQNLPAGWCTIEIGDAANYINGRAFKPEEWMSEGIPIIRIQNLNNKTAPYNYSTQLFESKYLIKKGDLLFAWAASLGTYIWDGEDAWLNQHIFKVEPYPFVKKEYLYIIFMAMISEFYNHSHGSGMVHITKKQFENIILLLPPIAEQHRIVAKIEALFTSLDNIQKALEV